MSEYKIHVSRYPRSIQAEEVVLTMKGIGDFPFFVNGLCAQVLTFTNPNSPLYVDPQANERDFRQEPNKWAYNLIGVNLDAAEHGYSNIWIHSAILLQDLLAKAANHELYLERELCHNIHAALECFKQWKKANIQAVHEKRGEKFGSETGWQKNDPLENIHALNENHYAKWEYDIRIASGDKAFCVEYHHRDGINTRVGYHPSLMAFLKQELGNGPLVTGIWETTRESLDNSKASYGKGPMIGVEALKIAYDKLCTEDDYVRFKQQHDPHTFDQAFPRLS